MIALWSFFFWWPFEFGFRLCEVIISKLHWWVLSLFVGSDLVLIVVRVLATKLIHFVLRLNPCGFLNPKFCFFSEATMSVHWYFWVTCYVEVCSYWSMFTLRGILSYCFSELLNWLTETELLSTEFLAVVFILSTMGDVMYSIVLSS